MSISPAELRAAFDVFDTDRSGTISRAELKAVLTRATERGSGMSDHEADEFFDKLDANSDGMLDLSEMASAMASEIVARAAAERACIDCGSSCNGITTNDYDYTEGKYTWMIRAGSL